MSPIADRFPTMVACAALGVVVACGGTSSDSNASTAASGAATKADDAQTSGAEETGGGDTEGGFACPAAQDVFPSAWPTGGPDCGTEDEIFVHRYDDDTFILRQSLCTSFEAPFIYMLFGEDRVLVEDAGAGGVMITDTVFGVVDQWLADNGKDSIEIVLVNSHAHGDHVAGNDEFAQFEGVTVVGFGVRAMSEFFEIDWPQQSTTFDLGGRLIDIIPIPGHEASHVALYDQRDGLLLTGDSLYSGRLFIDDFPTYVESNQKLLAFAQSVPVCWILGTHIEMTDQPGVDFEFGLDHHPNEHVLQLGVEHLAELVDGLVAMGDTPVQEAHDDFIIFPL